MNSPQETGIDEILPVVIPASDHKFESQGDAPFNVLKCRHCDSFASHHLNEGQYNIWRELETAKPALLRLIEEKVIGKDETEILEFHGDSVDRIAKWRNQFRAEQRSKLRELLGGAE